MHRLVRGRRAWLAGACAVVLIIAGGLAGYAGWQAWQGRCVAAVPDGDSSGPSPAVSPQQLEAALTNRLSEEWDSPDFRARVSEAVAVMLDPAEQFGTARFAVLDPSKQPAGQPTITSNGQLLVGAATQSGSVTEVWALDGATGEIQWSRAQRGADRGVVPMGDRAAFIQAPEGRPLTVATVDLHDGAVAACARLGEATSVFSDRTTVSPVGDDAVVVSQTLPGDRQLLSLLDLGADTPRWQRDLTPPEAASDLWSAGEVVVANGTPGDSFRVWEAAVEQDRYQPEQLRLRAYALADGAPAWEYAPDAAGGDPYVPQIVATTEEAVTILAMRLHQSDHTLEIQLVVLDAATGQPRWAQELPPASASRLPEARQWGDTVVAYVPGPDGPELLAYDSATGQDRWRIEAPVGNLGSSAVTHTGTVLLPTGGDGAGLVELELADGSTRTHFDGATVSEVTTGADLVAVTYFLADQAIAVLYGQGAAARP